MCEVLMSKKDIQYIDDQLHLHKKNGPAHISINGDQSYYIHGKRHREDGPAIVYMQNNIADNFYYNKYGIKVSITYELIKNYIYDIIIKTNIPNFNRIMVSELSNLSNNELIKNISISDLFNINDIIQNHLCNYNLNYNMDNLYTYRYNQGFIGDVTNKTSHTIQIKTLFISIYKTLETLI